MATMRLTIWNENVLEQQDAGIHTLYPAGIHEHLRRVLACDGLLIRTATLRQDAEHGLSRAVLDETDVLLWWGSAVHAEVSDAVADRIASRVNDGMGFIALHAAYASKPFQRLMGMPCTLMSRCAAERAHVWTTLPSHPIAQGVPPDFILEREQAYGELFSIPRPDDILFITGYQGGSVFRGGVTFTCGCGKVFYFHPGHETMPSLYNEHVLKILQNAVQWAAPSSISL